MKTVQKLIIVIALIVVVFGATGHALAAPGYTGTYQTATKAGTLRFAATRCGSPAGYCMGYWYVDGVRYPSFIGGSTGGFRWFYDKGYTKVAGLIQATYDPATGAFTGPITFYDKTGAVTDTGTASLK